MTVQEQSFKKFPSLHFLRLLILIVILVGMGLRFLNIDQKVYSADEVRSIMRFSGYTTQEVKDKAFIGEIITVENLQHFQHPNQDKSLNDAIATLAGNPEHPPMYHLLTRFWMQLFPVKNSARIFSILLSVLVFPCLYWFCVELFDSPLTGWVAIALLAVSPFHILVAQNTTQYNLWTVTILLSGSTLLKALRENKKISWIFYSIALALAFYSHLFSAVVAIAEGLYVILLERFKITRTLLNYCLAAIGSLLLFSPWLIIILNNLDKINKNTQYYRQFKTDIFKISKKLFLHFGHVFVDFFYRKGRLESFLHLLLFLLVVYSLYYLIRFTSLRIWLFVILLICVPTVFQIVPDLLSSSIRSLQARYYLPAFLGIQLSLSYLIKNYLDSNSTKKWLSYFWRQIFILLLVLGIISGLFLGWTRDAGLDDQRGTASGTNIPIAEALNKMEKPLVFTEATPSFLLALSYLVNDRVKFQTFRNGDVEQWQEKLNLDRVKGKYNNLLLLYPDEKFIDFVTSQHQVRMGKVVEGLFRLREAKLPQSAN